MGVESELNDEDLLNVVLDLAAADPSLTEDAELVVLAAMQGDEALRLALGGSYPSRPEPLAAQDGKTDVKPVGAFVKSIQVKGFRGVGAEASLSLTPGPGLTIVAGRNGSGKSSFAEAFELALTGASYRWSGNGASAALSLEHWRNVHDGDPCSIRVELAEEGVGQTTVGVDWAKDADLGERTTWVQRKGGPRETGVSSLGWGRALELYRPILSYEELGGLLEGRHSELYDALAVILGLERITDAHKRLATAVKGLSPSTGHRGEANQLKRVLAAHDDERARQAHTLLRKQRPDLDALQAIAAGTDAAPNSDLEALRALTQLRIPSPTEVAEVVRTLRETVGHVGESAEMSNQLAERRASLLRQALEVHQAHSDARCPVCGVGDLDAAWRARVEAELADEDERLREHRDRAQRLRIARSAAEELARRMPTPSYQGPFTLATLTAAQAALERWSRLPQGDTALADHLATRYDEVATAVTALRAEAETVLAGQQDAWAPLAIRLALWVEQEREVRRNEPTLKIARAASEFVKRNATVLQNQALEPLAGKARSIWGALKQESNVDLGAIQLDGTTTRRRVKVLAEVDGAATRALGVMSQGELHALALALFLPRATEAASPFQFILLDDPVQAMDPAKVDGFVDVLSGLAKDRQVIVMSHDDRLPEAVRRKVKGARIFEVTRGEKSQVAITSSVDPAGRYLDDAFALIKDPEVPGDVRARVLPGLCRMAVEAAARDALWGRRIRAGASRQDIEAAWNEAMTPYERIALALRDDRRADLRAWFGAHDWRREARGVIGKGVHEGLRDDPLTAVRHVEHLVEELQADVR